MMPDKCQWCGSTDIGDLQVQVKPPPFGEDPHGWPLLYRCRDCGTLHWHTEEWLIPMRTRWWILVPGNEVQEALTPTHKAAQG